MADKYEKLFIVGCIYQHIPLLALAQRLELITDHPHNDSFVLHITTNLHHACTLGMRSPGALRAPLHPPDPTLQPSSRAANYSVYELNSGLALTCPSRPTPRRSPAWDRRIAWGSTTAAAPDPSPRTQPGMLSAQILQGLREGHTSWTHRDNMIIINASTVPCVDYDSNHTASSAH